MHAGRGNDDDIGWVIDATAHQIRRPTTQEERADGLRSPTQEGREQKKWGGDGHITSPTFSALGRAQSVKKAARKSYHEHSHERRMIILIQSTTCVNSLSRYLAEERRQQDPRTINHELLVREVDAKA
jgi:hypothetical protein